jgi:hypothetical protein
VVLLLLGWAWYENRQTVRGERHTVSLALPKKQVCWEDLKEEGPLERSRGRWNAGFKMGREEMGYENLDCIAMGHVTVRWLTRVNKTVTSGSVSWSISASEDEHWHTAITVVDIALSLVFVGCELIAPFPHSLYIPSLTAHTRPLFPTPFTFPPSLRAPYKYIKTRLRTLCVNFVCART